MHKKYIKNLLAHLPWIYKLLKKIKYRFFYMPKSNKKYPAAKKQNIKQQLLIDVSVFHFYDNATGVQRVVREILHACIENPPEFYLVEPVYGHPYKKCYYYARTNKPIQIAKGDIFLGLDLILDTITYYKKTFEHYKKQGVKLYFVLYDLLPLLYPHFFKKEIVMYFKDWLKQITQQGDGIICISRTVADELRDALKNIPHSNTLKIGWFHLGADFQEGNKNCCLKNVATRKKAASRAWMPASESNNFYSLPENPGKNILMVSTIEPRKGYDLAFSAFEELWKQNEPVNLIIVGKPGWNVETLIQKLEQHPEKDKRFFWFQSLNDEALTACYEQADGLIMASVCEGFGLAIIEAAHYQLPILARDISIFHEIAGEYATYFSKTASPETLARDIKDWLVAIDNHTATLSEKINYLTWAESAKQLLAFLS